jgi:hypothetical protein
MEFMETTATAVVFLAVLVFSMFGMTRLLKD